MKKRGFTLIELIIVVAILGLLAATAFPRYEIMRLRAKMAEVDMVLHRVRSAQYAWLASWDCFANLRRTPEVGFPPGVHRNPWVSTPTSFANQCSDDKMAFIDIDVIPTGPTHFFYECERRDSPPDFTCSAIGDLDNDGVIAEHIFCTDHADTGTCVASANGTVSLFPFGILRPTPGTF